MSGTRNGRLQLHDSRRLVAALLAVALFAWLPAPAHAGGASGVAQLGDDQGVLDRLTVELVDLPAAPEGHTYCLWLVSGDGQRALLAAKLAPDADGNAGVGWSHPAGENLLGAYWRYSPYGGPTTRKRSSVGRPAP